MNSGTLNAQVRCRCPFFRSAEKKRIRCEGIVERSVISQTYQAEKDYKIQLSTFCCDKYQCCEIYQMLLKTKYPDEEDED